MTFYATRYEGLPYYQCILFDTAQACGLNYDYNKGWFHFIVPGKNGTEVWVMPSRCVSYAVIDVRCGSQTLAEHSAFSVQQAVNIINRLKA